MKYCPPVPFRPDLVYCYPEISLQLADKIAMTTFFIAGVIAIILYIRGYAK
jgi:hypothetical protein